MESRRNTVLEKGRVPLRYRNMQLTEAEIGGEKRATIFRMYNEGGLERSVSLPQYDREIEAMETAWLAGKAAGGPASSRAVGTVKILYFIGSGTFSQVFLASDLHNKRILYAVKTIDTRRRGVHEPSLRCIQREVEILRRVQGHPGIIKFYGAKTRDGFVSLYFEYFCGGELFETVKARKMLSEPESLAVFKQIVSAILFIHARNVCHLDLKLENVLVSRKLCVKLIDFGLAVECGPDGSVEGYGGTLRYSAPEAVAGGTYNGKLADAWSCGVMLFIMTNGCFPFRQSFSQMAKYRAQVTPETKARIAGLLRENPGERAYLSESS